VLVVVEHHEEDRAVLVVAVGAHPADEVDPLDAAASAVAEVVVSVAVAEAAVVSQEVAVVVVASVVDVDEEDTKCLDLGWVRYLPDETAKAQLLAFPSHFDPTITCRYHDHFAAFWSCSGFWVLCRTYGAL
jgi:hypothetical protein